MDGGSDTVQLWMGAIRPNWNEKYIGDVFRSYGVEVVQTKLIRDKVSNLPLGYAFVEFPNMQIAQAAMDRLNGKEIAGSGGAFFRLNWGKHAAQSHQQGSEHAIFVGDLSADTNDDTLATLFKSFFRSVTSVNVVMDSSTGKCKGYGFVRFADSAEMEKALETMSGTLCGSKRIRVNRAAPLKKVDASSSNPITLSTNSTNTTVFCGGLVDVTVDKNALRAHFAHVGEIAGVRIPASRGCGFVEFVRHEDAARAVETMNGSVLGSCTLRLSWASSKSHAGTTSSYASHGAYAGVGGHHQSLLHRPYSPHYSVSASSHYSAYTTASAPSRRKIRKLRLSPDVNAENADYMSLHAHKIVSRERARSMRYNYSATNVSTQTGGLSAMRVDVLACNRALMRGA